MLSYSSSHNDVIDALIRTCLRGDWYTLLPVSYDTVGSWLPRSSGGILPEP